jgi:chemotaxis protein CheD
MLQCPSADLALPVHVGMGQAIVGTAPTRFVAVLGSCVVISMYSAAHKLGILGHVVLPHTNHPTAMPTKYADIATPYILGLLAEHQIGPMDVVAKVAGGASMFGESGIPIGKANADAVLQSLNEAGIRVVATHVGGSAGRRIVFDCNNGAMIIETVGAPPVILD